MDRSASALLEVLRGADMVFPSPPAWWWICTGGLSPIVAEVARRRWVSCVARSDQAVPFEGPQAHQIAEECIRELSSRR